jgi:ABC-type Fe3+-hydroxamate transport system substrate-binding protein
VPLERSPRVVSLVPSATETLVAWGIDPVAVTRFCPQQPGFRTVGGTKDPNLAAIIALRPDLVVMCDQENRKPDAEALIDAGVNVLAVHITSIDKVGPEMARLAQALGLPPSRGWDCAPDLVDATAVTSAHRIKVFVPIWKRPWMTITADTFAGSLLASIGCDSVATGTNRYPEMSLEEATSLGTQLVLAPSEPYPFAERHRSTLEAVAATLFVDGQDLFWWGSRTPKAVRRLQDAVTAWRSQTLFHS